MIVLCVGPCRPGNQPINPSCHLEIIKVVQEHEYIQEGDIMIGGVMAAHLHMINVKFPLTDSERFLCIDPIQQNFRHFIDFRFVVEQTNKDPTRLPNLTLGYHIYDSCGNPKKAVRSVFQILSGTREPVPNYSCVGKRNIAGFIGDISSQTTVPIAQILTILGYSQISYGATDPSLSERINFPYFFRTVQNDKSSYFALGKLLRQFGWTWVGIITSDDISGDEEHQHLSKYLYSEGICIEFTVRLKINDLTSEYTDHDFDIIYLSSTSIILLCGTVSLFFIQQLSPVTSVLLKKTLILSTNWGANDMVVGYAQQIFNCSLVFVPGYHYHLDTPEMKSFLENLHPSTFPKDMLLEDIWMIFHLCLSEDPNKNHLYEYIYLKRLQNCTAQKHITDLQCFTSDYSSPRVHLAVDIMSQALHDMNMQLNEKSVKNREKHHYVHQQWGSGLQLQPTAAAVSVTARLRLTSSSRTTISYRSHSQSRSNVPSSSYRRASRGAGYLATEAVDLSQTLAVNNEYKIIRTNEKEQLQGLLHQYLKTLTYNSSDGPTFYFNENGEYITRHLIYNYIIANGLVIKNLIGESSPTWKSNTIPRAQCSDSCLPGFRKAPSSRAQSCCYDCVLCSEGEISNITDSTSCFKCPDMEWPNEGKNHCIARKEDFLSYTNDHISVFISSSSILLFIINLLILRVFISYWDTPIVRANNRSLSFLLLVSIKLSFLSVFLFLGRPVDITCMLRNITFGITFSIAVSSVLAKTIMVYIAFKATKPGSSWRKWVGVKLSNSVVFFCLSIQIIICMTWLAISPPFQELDLHTYPGTIIIQCNEGSAIGFYSVIGYMGLLAAVSFVLAFLARTLPDSFNEAKYITFSMLLFCSVWITMIPAYLSTKGKNTVCVEIFAILTSSAGLLFCIFLPKCYLILLRPEMNTKSHLLGKKTLQPT
ncbi:vomeronasal type-2 receptor 1-like [Xenopus laevis]|uniref:Vomeronasal type-2 receptor 1-like n=1 Tax=Xenopus laevis TaxID=8355 RepID=A0A8J1MCF4_XENLA|nr:vomeronasal type-2 receptor 1-like [Xenopus laevis]